MLRNFSPRQPRVRAKARGAKFGRKPAPTPHQRSEALARRAAGEALVEIAGPITTPMRRQGVAGSGIQVGHCLRKRSGSLTMLAAIRPRRG